MAQSANDNPFDSEEDGGALTYAPAAPKAANPFDETDFGLGPSSSATGAFVRGAERGALPAAGGLAGAGAGAEAGAAIGGGVGALFGGVGAAPGAAIGAFVGGVAGGFGGSYATEKAQDYALSKAPDSWVEALGQDDRQQRLDQEQHPYASFLGGMTPYALTMRPGLAPAAKLPENATALERLMANPTTARVFGGGLMGGIEIAQEKAAGEPVDWAKVGIATGFGVIFNRPTRLGEAIEGAVPRLLRRPVAVPSAPEPLPSARPFEGQEPPFGEIDTFGALALPEHIPQEPTLAEAGDLSIIGPGITEDVFQGAHQQDPSSQQVAQDAARQERAMLRGGVRPDVDRLARQMEPEAFGAYDAAAIQRDLWRDEVARLSAPTLEATGEARDTLEAAQAAYNQHVASRNGYEGGAEARRLRVQVREAQRALDEISARPVEETEELAAARQRVQEADYQLRDLGREVAAARRRAAEKAGWTLEPEPGAPSAIPTATQDPALREVLARPDVAQAIAEPQINHGGDVPFGAGASNNSKVTNIDRHIPQHDPRVVDRSGQPADLWKYLNIHEQVEKAKMDEGVPYKDAHEKFATAAERAAVEADGVDWGRYTEVMNGFLSHIEHEKPANPPPDLYTKPYPEAERHELAKASLQKPIEQQRAAIQQDVRDKLIAVGRSGQEADMAAALTSALYETHAARTISHLRPRSAEDIYREEAPAIEARPVGRARGGYHEANRIISLARDADASTYVHELAHDWFNRVMRDATRPDADATMRADAQTIRRYVGARGEKITTRAKEKFARSFEQYLREGVAPSARLAGVFAKFRTWLLQIYQTLRGLGAPINDDIRGVFDRMLAEDPRRVVISEHPGGPTLADIHAADAREIEPADAEPAADRIAAERERFEAEQPQEISHEIETAVAEGERAAGEPAGEAGERPGGLREVEPGRQEAGAEPAGGGVGAGGGAQREGGNGPETKGGRLQYGTEPERRDRSGSGPQPLAPRPAEHFEPADDRLVDRAGNIRVENLTNVEDVAQAIRDSAERNDDFRSVRGGMTRGQMSDLADTMEIGANQIREATLERLLGGSSDLGARILAARRLVVESARVVSNLMARAANSDDPNVLAEFGQAVQRHDMVQSALSGVTAEWGRAGTAFKSLMDGWDKVENVGELVKQNTGRTLFQLKMMAKLGKNLDTPGKVSKFLRDVQKRSGGRMLLEYFVNNLISGIPTHVTYVIGGQVLLANKIGPETLAAALLGRVRERLGREGERIYAGEAWAQVQEYVRSLPKAAQATIEAVRTGQTTLLPGEKAHPLTPYAGDDPLLRIARTIQNADVNWSETSASAFGLIRGARDGILANAALLKSGGEAGAPRIGLSYSPLGQIPDVAIRGVPVLPVGSAIRLPSRGVAALHSFQRTLAYSIDNNAMAYRQATREGLTGTAFDARVAELRQNPSEAQMEAARGDANELTLMGNGREFVKRLSHLANYAPKLPLLGETPIFRFIDPFIKIAANIVDQSLVQRTPLGLLSSELRADLLGKNGNVRQDMASARMLLGSVYALAIGGLAAEGYVTGAGPVDPNKRAVWMMAGNRAHSVRVGDMWYDVHRLGPLGMIMGTAADMYDVAHRTAEGDMLQAGVALQHGIVQNMLDESFMRGPAELIQAIEDPQRYGERYIQNQIGSFVPYSVGLSYMDRATDPYARQARTVLDSIRAKVPGLSESLFPRRDIWGEPLPNPDALGVRGLTAIYESRMNRDPVNVALASIGAGVAPVPRSIRNVKLTDAEYDDFARLAGRMTKQRLDVIVNSPDWRQSFDTVTKRQVIQVVVEKSREAARGVVMGKYPHIPADATRQKNDKFTQEAE